MVLSFLLLVGLGIAVFAGFNIGGSNVGVAFGPAVGSRAVSAVGAAALMTICFFLGGWTLGRHVIHTMGSGIVPASTFTLPVAIGVLFFIGLTLFLGNYVGVPASTSMTGVGAIIGVGLAAGNLDWAVTGQIIAWWIVSPLIAFWVSGVIGRYLYPTLTDWFAINQTEGGLLVLDRSGFLLRPALGPNTTRREFGGTLLVVIIACYTAFSAGAGNTANAIAPLIAAGVISIEAGIILVGLAVGLGAFTVGRKTIDTIGGDLTDMPLLAALVVAVISSTLEAVLAAFGIPASVVVISTMSIVGLGWGRATRVVSFEQARHGEADSLDAVSTGALGVDTDHTPTVGGGGKNPDPGTKPIPIGDEDPADVPKTADLFRPRESIRVIVVQNFVPVLATVGSFLLVRFVLTPGV